MPDSKEIIAAFMSLQDRICTRLEDIDGKQKFLEDNWDRTEGGGGRTRIIENGLIIEKGGVNFSHVHGEVTDLMKMNTEITADEFLATGVSIVLHANSPHIPIIHMNVRYFELSDGKYWFGGGIDLTPHYVVMQQAKEFHRHLKSVCDKYDEAFYSDFKKWADEYFFIPHRGETRGVGGIFFDHLKEGKNLTKANILSLCLDLGGVFPELYEYQVSCGKDLIIEKEHIDWMLNRRGRYVEFNLVNDRGTKFGLVSGGRTESILMSLPPRANWSYQRKEKQDSKEQFTMSMLRKNVDWLS